MIKISDFFNFFNVSVKAVRYYDEDSIYNVTINDIIFSETNSNL